MAEQTQNALPGNDPETMQQGPAAAQQTPDLAAAQQTPETVQAPPAAPAGEATQAPPENAVTLVVEAPAEEAPKKGKKSHRQGAKYKKAGDEPLADERAPKRSLSTKRGLIRFLLLTVITAGIYTLFFLSGRDPLRWARAGAPFFVLEGWHLFCSALPRKDRPKAGFFVIIHQR